MALDFSQYGTPEEDRPDFSSFGTPEEPAAAAPAKSPVIAAPAANDAPVGDEFTMLRDAAASAPPPVRKTGSVIDMLPDAPRQGPPVREDVSRAIELAASTGTPEEKAAILARPDFVGQSARLNDPGIQARTAQLYDLAIKRGAKHDAAQAWAEHNAVLPDASTAAPTKFDFATASRTADSNVVARAAEKTLVTAKQQAGGLVEAALDFVGADSSRAHEMNTSYQRTLDAMGEGRRGATYLEQQLEGALTSIGTQGPQMLYATLGGPGAAAVGLGAIFFQTAGQEYTQGRQVGLSEGDALHRAAFQAAAEVIGEEIGLPGAKSFAHALLKSGAATKDLVPRFAAYLAKENLGEQVTTAMQFGYDKFADAGLNKNSTLEDYLKAVMDTGVQTTMQTLITGAAGKVARTASGAEGEAKRAAEAATAADESRAAAIAKWDQFNALLKIREPAAAPRPELQPVDFQAPNVPAMKADNLTASPGVAAPPVGNEIPFQGNDPAARAAAIEQAQALETARQQDQATRVVAPGENVRRDAVAANLDLAPSPAPLAGNEIDIRPFLEERALMRANGLTMEQWLGQGDLLGRPFSNEVIGALSQLESHAEQNPADAADIIRAIDNFDPKKEAKNEQSQSTAAAASPASDAAVAQAGEKAAGQSEAARGSEAAAGQSVKEASHATQTGQQQQGDLGQHPGDASRREGGGRQDRQRASEEHGARASDRGGSSVSQGANERRGASAALDFSAHGTPEVDHAAHAAATSPRNDLPQPTEAQKEAGNYQKGHVRVAGVDISIENPAGSKRRPEWPVMKSHYGYIRGTVGRDKDHVDIFVRPGTPRDFAGPIFVVDQVNAKGGFDEHKVVLGAASISEARALYSENYSKGFKVGPVTEMTQDQFRAWTRSPFTKRAVKSLSLSEWRIITGEASSDATAADLAKTGTRQPEVPAKTGERQLTERRADAATRKRVADMTPDERAKALLTSELTGLGNRRAYDEAKKKPVQASLDVDGLKWVNDNLGHGVGDDLLRAVGEAIRDEGIDGYHLSGDEFVAQFNASAEASAALDRVRARLAGATVTAVMPDGTKVTQKGLGFSYGTGKDFQTADQALRADKASREAGGQRVTRGAEPAGVSREAAAQTDRHVRDTAAPSAVVAPATKEAPATAGVSASGTPKARIGDKVLAGMEPVAVQKAAAKFIRRSRIPVTVVQDVATLKTEANLKRDPKPDTKGLYLNGRAYLVAENLASDFDVERILMHELQHAGIDVRFGMSLDARERALKDVVSKNRELQLRAEGWRIRNGQEHVAELMQDENLTLAEAEREMFVDSMDEAVAYFAEAGRPFNGLKAFIAVIQKGLRALGLDTVANMLENATNAQALAFIAESRLATEGMRPSALGLREVPAYARTGKERLELLAVAQQFMDDMVARIAKDTQRPDIGITLTRTLPNALQAVGVPKLPLHLPGNVAMKAVGKDPELEKHRHTQDDPTMLSRVVPDIFEPVMIFQSATQADSVIALTRQRDTQGAPIIVTIRKRGIVGREEVGVITSIYPRQNAAKMFETWARDGLLLYQDRAKVAEVTEMEAAAPSTTVRLQLPWVVQLSATAGPTVLSDAHVVNRYGAMFARGGPGPINFPGTAAPATGGTKPPNPGTKVPSGGTNPPAGGTIRPGSWNAPGTSQMDNVIYTLQDKHIDTKRVVREIEKNVGQLADQVNPYLQEELFHGRTAKKVTDFLEHELKPLLKDMASRGVKIGDFEEWLHARHAEERNQQIARINPQLPDGGSGMKTADARAVLTRARASGMATAYQALAKQIDAITTQTRSEMVRYGLEAPSTVAAWQAAYQHYVPLQREDMETGGLGTGQGFSVRGNVTKRATGSERKVVDILANVALQRERVIARGEKRRVGEALLGLAQANPNPDFWRVDQPPKITRVDDRTGLVTSQVDPLYKSRDNVLIVPVPDAAGNVVDHAVVFNEHDPRAMRMAQSLKNLDVDQLGTILGTAAKFTRYFASINTQYNPVFGVVNLTRDAQSAMLNLTTTPIAGKQLEVAGHALSALRGIYADLRATRAGKPATSAWAQLWEEFQNEGGQTGYRELFRTSADRAKALQDEIDSGNSKRLDKVAFEATKGWLSDYNEAMENAMRLAAYKVALDQGISKQRSASIAKNLTVNFNRKGQIGSQAGALYAFFNASMQGTARTMETLTGPKGRQIIAGGVLLGVLQAVALALAGFDDDEPPEFIREKALVIPIGGKKFISIPMAQGFLILPNMGRLATQYVMGGFKKSGKHVANLVGVLADSFNPIGNAGVSIQTIAPTVLDPFVALSENRDWTGKPIAREDMNKLHPTPGHTRAKDTASDFAKVMSRAVNALSGGTAHKPGAFSPTPDQIDYLMGQFSGGVGREILKTEQAAASLFTGEKLPPHKIPLVGRMYGDAESASSQASKFYENLKDINEHGAELKGRRHAGEPVGDYLRANPEAKLEDGARAAEREVSAMRKQKRELQAKGGDRERVAAIEDRIAKRMERFNEAVKRARAQ